MSSKSEAIRERNAFSLAELYGEDISPDAANADLLAFERSMDDMLPVLLASDVEKTGLSVEPLRKKFAVAAAKTDEIVLVEHAVLVENSGVCRDSVPKRQRNKPVFSSKFKSK
ncbi:hypothetical protein PEC302107_37490 [Pectobacterium araliae]|uniref:Uncharacterized protein n=1 Tax=Pectobacterium araliae TaxID=3073862 RepID=A0AAN0MKA0_9GAMM|nr:hypothetical protein PEC302110_13080 [Pectobacterium sp. MAFF 302110]GKW22020.1 hypothetical protein PEC302107_37490 [Pectobacterium carotovorum subsp. carotovorum]